MIRVSEIFKSIQGEGSTAGRPSVFVRLQSCNLMCGGIGTEKDGQLHNGATWRCDTIETWMQGQKWEINELADYLASCYRDAFKAGTQLIITGGEPLLQRQEVELLIREIQLKTDGTCRVEIETNGTLNPLPHHLVSQYNVSPKTSNSGMDKNKRIVSSAIQSLSNFAASGKAIFKFVVTREQDIEEVMKDFIEPFQIPAQSVWLMPGCSNRQQYEKVAPVVADICGKYGFQFSSRLQVNIWNEVTGV